MNNIKKTRVMFIWADGGRDYRFVYDPPPPIWHRFKFDRDSMDIDFRYECIAEAAQDALYCAEQIVDFKRMNLQDGTLIYKEKK